MRFSAYFCLLYGHGHWKQTDSHLQSSGMPEQVHEHDTHNTTLWNPLFG